VLPRAIVTDATTFVIVDGSASPMLSNAIGAPHFRQRPFIGDL
jgi:hypothetical protein